MIHPRSIRTALILGAAALLAGCSTTPSPVEAVAPGNAQLRLSHIAGRVEAGTGLAADGAGAGEAWVLTVLGALPPGVTATLEEGVWRIEARGPAP